MTPDELEVLILESDSSWDLQKALENLDEKERAKLSSSAQKIFNQLYKSRANETASERLKVFIGRRNGDVWKHWNAAETRRATLAIFGLCQISAVKKREIHVWHDEKDVLERMIRDRKPDWLDDWIEYALEPGTNQLDFATLRSWIRDGVCRKPTVDGYFQMFAWHLMRTGFYGRNEVVPPISTQLLADAALLEDIEGIFRVENVAFNTNGWLRKGAAPDYETWTDALVKLSAQGHQERGKLLKLALDGLTLDLKQNQLAGFHGFYKRMVPSSDEVLQHQQHYVSLLCHPVGHVVKFAIDMLRDVERQGALDTEPVLSEIQTVFLSEGKGNAVAALKLINKIIGRQKSQASTALDAVCEALRHSHADVQAQALVILEENKGLLSDTQIDTLSDLESFVAASNRKRLVALATGNSDKGEEAPAAAAESSFQIRGSRTDYAPLPIDGNAQRVLSPETAIAPIESVDELIAAILHAVEVVGTPDEVERIFDGISRFADDRPADFDSRVAPLRHRIEKGQTGQNSILIGQTGFGLPMLDLLYTWMTGTLYQTPKGKDQYSQYYEDVDAFVAMAMRFRAISERVAKRKGQLMLSAPTHKGGWIDPLVWIERISALGTTDALMNDIDFILSLLRLAPDHRFDALAKAASLPPPMRSIASFALGGDEAPTRADRKNYAAWIAAARCRSPHKDWSSEFASLDLDDKWPGGLRPARYDWRSSHKKGQYENQTRKTPEFDVTVTCDGEAAFGGATVGGLLSRMQQALGGRIATEWQMIPTAAVNRRMEKKHYWSGELTTPWVTQWLAYVWPQDPSAAMIRGANKLIQRMDENSSNWTPGFGYLQALFQKNRPWGEPGHLLLCLALVAKDADAKGLAVDALVEGIDGRLFDPDLFAVIITRVAQGEWVKYNRLADGLMLVVQVSETHARVVGDALQKWLPLIDFDHKNTFRILEVLVETQATTKAQIANNGLEALRRISGSGKAAKLANQLLRE